MKNLLEYGQFVLQTIAPAADESQKDGQIFSAMGLCSEAGEIAEIIRKHYYQGTPWKHGDKDEYLHLKKELGDAFWFWMCCTIKSGFDPYEIIAANVEKLKARYPEGHFSVERNLNRAENDV